MRVSRFMAALGVGQGVAHGAALGAGMIDAADHPDLRHVRCP